MLPSPTAWLGRRTAHANGDPARWTNPERSNELSDQIAHIAMLPTPTRQDGSNVAGRSQEERNTPPLNAMVRMLPTPRARVDKEHGPDGKHWGELRPVVESLSTGATTSPPSSDGKPSTALRLNPSFVEWMMGTPVCGECGRGWTDSDCPHSATAFTSMSPGSSVST